MKVKIKKLFVSFSLMLIPFFLSAPSIYAAANIQGSVSCGVNNLSISGSAASNCSGTTDQTGKFNGIVKTVLIFLSAIVGTVAVVMLIVGGFRYITSGGSSDKVASAKNTIIYALIGLVIVALAQIIVQFVLHRTATA